MEYGTYSIYKSHHYGNDISEVYVQLSSYLTEDKWEDYTWQEKETFILEIGEEVCHPYTPCGYIFLG